MLHLTSPEDRIRCHSLFILNTQHWDYHTDTCRKERRKEEVTLEKCGVSRAFSSRKRICRINTTSKLRKRQDLGLLQETERRMSQA